MPSPDLKCIGKEESFSGKSYQKSQNTLGNLPAKMEKKDSRQRENILPNFQFIVARAWESCKKVGRDEPRKGRSQVIRAMYIVYRSNK